MGRTGGDPKGGDIWDLKLEDLFSDAPAQPAARANDAAGPWVINLATSAEPISIPSTTLNHLRHLQVYQVTAWKSDRLLFRLRLGPIDSELQASALLSEILREYPEAEVLRAGEDDIRMIAAVAASSGPRPPSPPKRAPTRYGLDEFIASQNDEPPPPPPSRASVRESAAAAARPNPSPPAAKSAPPVVERRAVPRPAPQAAPPPAAPSPPPVPSAERRVYPRPSPASPRSPARTIAPPATAPKAASGPPSWLQAAARAVLDAAAPLLPSSRPTIERRAVPPAPPPPVAAALPPPLSAAPPAAARAIDATPPASMAHAPATTSAHLEPASQSGSHPPATTAARPDPPPHSVAHAPATMAARPDPAPPSVAHAARRAPVSPAHKSLDETDTALPQLKLPPEPPPASAPAARHEGFVGAIFDMSSDAFLELSLAPDAPREPLRDIAAPPADTTAVDAAKAPPPGPAIPVLASAGPSAASREAARPRAAERAPAPGAQLNIPVLENPVSRGTRRDRRAAAKAAKAEAARRAAAVRAAAPPPKPAPPPAPEPRTIVASPAAARPLAASAAAATPPPAAEPRAAAPAAPTPAARPAAPVSPPAERGVAGKPAAPPEIPRAPAPRAEPVSPSIALPPAPPAPRAIRPPERTTIVRGIPAPRPINVPARHALQPRERPVTAPAARPVPVPAAAQRPMPAPVASRPPPVAPVAVAAPPMPATPPAPPPTAKAEARIQQFEVLGGSLPDLDSTQTIRALTIPELEDEDAEKLFAIELMTAATVIPPEQIPNLAIFSEYHLYIAVVQVGGRSAHALKLGFFTDDAPAQAVAGYLSSYFDGPKVARVSLAERERFANRRVDARKDSGDSGTHAAIDIASPAHAPTTSLAELAEIARRDRKRPKR